MTVRHVLMQRRYILMLLFFADVSIFVHVSMFIYVSMQRHCRQQQTEQSFSAMNTYSQVCNTLTERELHERPMSIQLFEQIIFLAKNRVEPGVHTRCGLKSKKIG